MIQVEEYGPQSVLTLERSRIAVDSRPRRRDALIRGPLRFCSSSRSRLSQSE